MLGEPSECQVCTRIDGDPAVAFLAYLGGPWAPEDDVPEYAIPLKSGRNVVANEGSEHEWPGKMVEGGQWAFEANDHQMFVTDGLSTNGSYLWSRRGLEIVPRHISDERVQLFAWLSQSRTVVTDDAVACWLEVGEGDVLFAFRAAFAFGWLR